jgi:hypothetical protein
MSPETDRVPVPTNGKGPHQVEEPASPTDGLPPDQAAVAFTPTQLAVGFGILASLILLLAGRMRRRGRSGSRGPFGRR